MGMDTRTGHLHEFNSEFFREATAKLMEQADGLARILKVKSVEEELRQHATPISSLVGIKKLPDPACKLCGGTGSVKTYFEDGETRRFKPCECVEAHEL